MSDGRSTGYALVLAATVGWALNGPLARIALDAGLTPMQLASVRSAGSAVVAVAVAGVVGRLWRIDRRQLVSLVLFGVLGIATAQWLFFEAVARMDVGIALTIVYTGPLAVAAYMRARHGERAGRVVVGATAAGVAGVAIALLGGEGGVAASGVGLAFAIGAALAYATQVVLAARAAPDVPAISRLAVAMATSAAVWTVFAPVTSLPGGYLSRRAPFGELSFALTGAELLVVILAVGTILPYFAIIAGAPRIGPSATSTTTMLEPLIASALAWPILDQTLAPLQIVGVLLVVASVATAERARQNVRAASQLARA